MNGRGPILWFEKNIYSLDYKIIRRLYFIKKKSRTSAVSSTNFGSILIFASCVIGT